MRVKLYSAAGMPQAMALIRGELGPDAVILNARRVGAGVEVTAARDEADPLPPADHTPAPKRIDTDMLRAHGTPEALAAKLGAGPLPFALSVVLRFQPLDAATLRRPLLFVGPPGAGKTLTVARLATRLVLAKVRPEIVTADTSRAGAYEQLAAYTGLLGLTLHGLEDLPVTQAPLLIDGPGLDPFAHADRTELTRLIARTGALPVLVLPGGIDAEEATDLADGFVALGAARLDATRLDVSRRLGGILAAATRLPLAEAGIGPAAATGLVPMTPDLLAQRLVRTPYRRHP